MANDRLPFLGVYRITHWENLQHILKFGIYATNHVQNRMDAYRFIGDDDLTRRRASHPLKSPAKGVLGDYVPFYFGRRSPMLYTLHKKGLAKQEEVIYLLVKIEDLVNSQVEFCFTDGQAYQKQTLFYTNLADLKHLDKAAIEATYWKATEEDRDITRRKSSELLVYRHLPAHCISGIVVASEELKQKITQIVGENNFTNLPIVVKGDDYYFL